MKQQPAPALPPSPLRHASQQRWGNCKKVVSATQRTILANASDERQYFATTLLDRPFLLTVHPLIA